MIINGLNDQIPLLVWYSVFNSDLLNYQLYNFIFSPLIEPFSNNQPLYWFFATYTLRYLGPNGFMYLVVFTILLLAFCTYLLFRNQKHWYVYALLFVFSPYVAIHAGNHLDILQIWPIPVFFILLKKTKPLLLGLFLAFSILLSNYIGFILIVTYFFYSLIVQQLKNLKQHLLSIILTALVIIPFLIPFIKINYFTHDATRVGFAQRPYEDFFTFSSRPWYFFIPPVKNPWLGQFSQKIIDKLENTGYFLADDYFAVEHQANYFGLIFVTTVMATTFLAKAKESKNLFLLAFVLVLLMMPPFFTISGLQVYTPGWLMYKIFPMFRVTARFGVVVHMLLLLILARNVETLSSGSEKTKKFFSFFMPLLLIITIFETFIPIQIYKPVSSPDAYTYLSQLPFGTVKFAAYPYNRTDEALFWLPTHQQLLANPRGFKTAYFDSESFTKVLNTYEGVENYKKTGGGYVVAFKKECNWLDQFGCFKNDFSNLSNVELVAEFSDAYLYMTK